MNFEIFGFVCSGDITFGVLLKWYKKKDKQYVFVNIQADTVSSSLARFKKLTRKIHFCDMCSLITFGCLAFECSKKYCYFLVIFIILLFYTR